MYAEANNNNNKKDKHETFRWILVILACLLVVIPTGFIIKQCTSGENATKGDTKYHNCYENLLKSLKQVENNIARLLVFDKQDDVNYKVATIDANKENIYVAELTINNEYKDSLFAVLEDGTIDLAVHFNSYSIYGYEVVNFKEFEIEKELISRLTYYCKSASDQYYCVASYIEKQSRPLLENPELLFEAPSSEEEAPVIDLTKFRKVLDNEAGRDVYKLNKYMLNEDMKGRAN